MNSHINSHLIADSMKTSIQNLSTNIREILFQSKSEQTFSELLCEKLNSQLEISDSKFLVEIKGQESKSETGKKTLNSHDIALLDCTGTLRLTIENKVWYHFDGAKGLNGVLNQNVIDQLKGDIFKTRLSMDTYRNQGFILICLVTPNLFTKYESSHKTALKRVNGDFEIYMRDSVAGIRSYLSTVNHLKDLIHLNYRLEAGNIRSGMLDIFCAEIKEMGA